MPLRWPILLVLGVTAPAAGVHAQALDNTCHASSSYDLTLRPDSLLFDRPQPAPFHIVLRDGALQSDGVRAHLSAEQQDRMTLFERDLRALVPRARAVAAQGVDLAVQAAREEAANLSLSAATRAEFDRRLADHAAALKQRIATSNTTHDWQQPAMDRYLDSIAGDLLPLLAADLGRQAIDAAMTGDLQAAARLRDSAASLASDLRPRLERRMAALRPRIQALCPAVDRLAELQQGVPDASGRPLRLLQVGQ